MTIHEDKARERRSDKVFYVGQLGDFDIDALHKVLLLNQNIGSSFACDYYTTGGPVSQQETYFL